jgi:hypothetical protein
MEGSTRFVSGQQSYGRDLVGYGGVVCMHELNRATTAIASRFSARRESEMEPERSEEVGAAWAQSSSLRAGQHTTLRRQAWRMASTCRTQPDSSRRRWSSEISDFSSMVD